MEFIDISMPIRDGMDVWPGDPEVILERASGDGEPVVTRLTLGTHTGTHVDTPAHLNPPEGAVDPISSPIPAMLGPCVVIEVAATGELLEGASAISGEDIEDAIALLPIQPSRPSRILLKHAATPYAASLSTSASRWLVERDVLLVGVSWPSVDGPGNGPLIAHRILLSSGVVILENLCLERVTPGEYRLVALPMFIEGADGSPVRAILLPSP